MMPSQFAFLLGTPASLILWIPSNPTQLGTHHAKEVYPPLGSRLPPLCGL